MKDNLKGRIVGYTKHYLLDPSQVEEGESLDATQTCWGKVIAHFESEYQLSTVVVESIHEPNPVSTMVFAPAIHTIMPESYEHD